MVRPGKALESILVAEDTEDYAIDDAADGSGGVRRRGVLTSGVAALGATTMGNGAAASHDAGAATHAESPSGVAAPDIVVYEDDSGQAKAVTTGETYTGEDVFDAANQAIDAHLAADPVSDSLFRDGPGDLECVFKPGSYQPSTPLTIDQKAPRRLSIVAPQPYGVWIDTRNIDEGPVFEVNPEAGDTFTDRVHDLYVQGFFLRDPDMSREQIGFYFNDVSRLAVEYCRAVGMQSGLRIENAWQGKIDFFSTHNSGSAAAETAAIDVEAGYDVQSATNHLEFNHLQGGNGCEHAYLEMTGVTRQCWINYPNIELSDATGFSFQDHVRVAMSNVWVKDGGDPVIDHSGQYLVLDNCYMYASGTAIRAGAGVPRLVGSNLFIKGGDGADLVQLDTAAANLTGVFIYGHMHGRSRIGRGITAEDCSFLNISNVTVRQPGQAGIKVTDCESDAGIAIGNVSIEQGSRHGEHPVTLENVSDCVLDTVTASIDSTVPSKPVVRTAECTNLTLSNITPVEDADGEFVDESSTFRDATGSVTVPADRRRTTVDHHLAGLPDPEGISITAGDGWIASAASQVEVPASAITTSSFDVVLDAAPGQPVDLRWRAAL
jgi:hypothetical protein